MSPAAANAASLASTRRFIRATSRRATTVARIDVVGDVDVLAGGDGVILGAYVRAAPGAVALEDERRNPDGGAGHPDDVGRGRGVRGNPDTVGQRREHDQKEEEDDYSNSSSH